MSPTASLSLGQTVSHYRLLEYVGSGGMSVIYKAEDTVLGRTVAVKFLSDSMTRDASVVDRFRREARTASSLNHPNICTIHEIGEHEGQPFIVMEYLEGRSLRDVIRGHPLETNRLVDYGLQIATGLEAAHSRGIIHRDLKPANIFITTSGYAKILDFGLAKLSAPLTRVPSQSTTGDEHLSTPGMVLGTMAYMSPEQALGKELDARTDLFSFGVVLYEMATGILPFRGDTSAAVFDAILHSAPAPPVRLNPGLPAELERIIDTCLEKECETRYQSATEICADLKRLKRDSSSAQEAAVEVRQRSSGAWRWWAAGGLVAMAAAAVGAGYLIRPAAPPSVTRIEPITRDGLMKMMPYSDGTRVYFSEMREERIAVAQVSASGGEVSQIATPLANVIAVDLAPDRSGLLVMEHPKTSTLSPLWLLPLPGGTPRRLGDLQARDAAWTPDGKGLIFTRGSEIWRARADGSDPRRILQSQGTTYGARLSPDGRRIRYTVYETGNTMALWEASADGSNQHLLLPGWQTPATECCGRWTPDGKYYIFVNEKHGDIWTLREGVPWWSGRRPEPVQLTTGPLMFMYPSFAPDGGVMYSAGTQPRGELARFDPQSKQSRPYLGGISAGELDFSRDGQWVAYVSYPDETIWRCRVDGSDRLQLTSASAATLPHWSPDGTQIAFVSTVWGKPWKIYVVPTQGGVPQELVAENHNEVDPAWSPDGKRIAFGRLSSRADTEPLQLFIADVETHAVETIPGSEGLFSPRWSPDGQFIAALSADSRRVLLYNVASRTWSDWYTSPEGGVAYPTWSRDGRSLYFAAVLTGRPSERRVGLGKRDAEMVADLAGERRYSETWGSWNGIAPDGSVLFVRDASTQEIYALTTRGL